MIWPHDRINNLLEDDTLQVSPERNSSPQSRKFMSLDGLILDIFDSDESAAQTDSFYPFVPSKCPAGSSWAGWAPSDYISLEGSHGEEDSTAENGHETEHGHLSGDSGTTNPQETADKDIVDGISASSGFFQTESHDSELGSLMFSNSNSEFDDCIRNQSEIPESELFKSTVVDPQLLNMEEASAG
jgi:hypothetical protein